VLIFGGLAWWETRQTWRPWLMSRQHRWLRHIGLGALSFLCVRVVFPLFTIGAAIAVQNKSIGLLNNSHLPYLSRFVIAILALDLIIYMLHRLLHKYQFLWRIHRVHHIDTQLDVTTGLRFHPLEAILTMGVKLVGVTFLGAPPLAVFVFEILLSMATLFTHVNVCLKPRTEKALRWLIVSPGMHRIHHSDYAIETNSNYGFCFSWWDRLFGTYIAIPESGERKVSIGLEDYRDPKYQTVENMLLTPFNTKDLKIWPKKNPKTKLSVCDTQSTGLANSDKPVVTKDKK
jgi:sterol desaturase/sphingolipid hydroxylase (fatty acid hydroxylase superfamily)